MKIYTWNSTECKILIEYLKQTCEDRDPGWFNKDVVAWFELNNVYAAVQNFNGAARLLTRLYIEPDSRVKGMTSGPPVLQLLKKQLEWSCYKFSNAFVSFDYDKRRVAERHVKTAFKYGLNAKLLEGTYRTCNEDDIKCNQHIVFYKLSDEEFPLCRLT